MKNDLLSYVETVMELEKTVYTQSQLQKELKKKIGTLGLPRVIDTPMKETADLKDNLIAGVFLGGLICAIIGGVYGLFSGEGFFGAIFSLIENAISGVIIGAVIGFIGGVIYYFVEKKRYENDYLDECASCQRERKEDQERVNKEKEQAKQLQKLVVDIGIKRAETEALLQQYYDLNVIHKDYRSLQAVCKIFEYLEKGICTDLQGANGVYSKMMMEGLFDMLRQGIDTIISKLDSLQRTNVMLYHAIQEGNRNVKQLMEKTDRQIRLAEKNNELMAINNYNQQQQLIESRYQSGLQTYALIKWSEK